MKKIKLSDRLELSQVVMGCMRIAGRRNYGTGAAYPGGNMSGYGSDVY